MSEAGSLVEREHANGLTWFKNYSWLKTGQPTIFFLRRTEHSCDTVDLESRRRRTPASGVPVST